MTKDPFAPKPAARPTGDKLGQLSRYVEIMRKYQSKVAQLEEELKEAKRALTQVEEESIPAYMEELGLKSITLSDGSKVQINSVIYASIPADRHDEAMAWLVSNGHSDLIKLMVQGQFGKEQYETARAVSAYLNDAGAEVSTKESVHPSTLRAFIKEQLEQGEDIPLDVFGARPINKAVIK